MNISNPANSPALQGKDFVQNVDEIIVANCINMKFNLGAPKKLCRSSNAFEYAWLYKTSVSSFF